MQMSPLDRPNAQEKKKKKKGRSKGFFNMGKQEGVDWVDQWLVVNTKQQFTFTDFNRPTGQT